MTTKQSLRLSDRLLRYSATACLVTSTSLLLGAQSAVANGDPGIVYVGAVLDPGQTYSLDLDNNGENEFMFSVQSTTYPYTYFQPGFSPQVIPISNASIIMRDFIYQSAAFIGQFSNPYALNTGVAVAASPASGSWIQPSWSATLTSSVGYMGYWINKTGLHYLGVRIIGEDSQPHYAWVELTVDDASPRPNQLTIHRYAYNHSANAAITTGSGPTSVDLASASATGGLQAVAAGAFAALGGALTWIRRKLKK